MIFINGEFDTAASSLNNAFRAKNEVNKLSSLGEAIKSLSKP